MEAISQLISGIAPTAASAPPVPQSQEHGDTQAPENTAQEHEHRSAIWNYKIVFYFWVQINKVPAWFLNTQLPPGPASAKNFCLRKCLWDCSGVSEGTGLQAGAGVRVEFWRMHCVFEKSAKRYVCTRFQIQPTSRSRQE